MILIRLLRFRTGSSYNKEQEAKSGIQQNRPFPFIYASVSRPISRSASKQAIPFLFKSWHVRQHFRGIAIGVFPGWHEHDTFSHVFLSFWPCTFCVRACTTI